MPLGDGTGPIGMGPMTGRGAGYCAGYPVPGYMNPYGGSMGYGRGMGYPVGMGYPMMGGYSAGWYASPYAAWGRPFGGRSGYAPYAGAFGLGRGFLRFGRGPGRGRRRW